jgi:hypothetical protein
MSSDLKADDYLHKFVLHKKTRRTYYVVSVSNMVHTTQKMITYAQMYQSNEYPFGTLWTRTFDDFAELIDDTAMNGESEECNVFHRFSIIDGPDKNSAMFKNYCMFLCSFNLSGSFNDSHKNDSKKRKLDE